MKIKKTAKKKLKYKSCCNKSKKKYVYEKMVNYFLFQENTL